MILLFNNLFLKFGLTDTIILPTSIFVTIVIIVTLAWLAYLITKKIVFKFIQTIIQKNNFNWYNEKLISPLLTRIAFLSPALIFHLFIGTFPELKDLFQRLLFAYMIFIGMTILSPLFNIIEAIYNHSIKAAKQRPITGYLEIVQIFLYIIAVILIISTLINRSPGQLLAGIGALTAVILLIFKDTILGFVASMKVSSADMVRIGDWIEMPKYGADGNVIEINLTAIKVQNWDKTISTIPTYSLVSDSFINWRGMEESGGRRIKRAINIDMTSVKFCDKNLLDKFKKMHLIKEYIANKEEEILTYNKKYNFDTSIDINGRKITNLGTFRAYLQAYLHAHPKINNDMTFLIRHLEPGEKGLPIEIYVFSNDQQWANYETIQADIFDHVIAAIPEFELRVFQNPSGYDFNKLISTK